MIKSITNCCSWLVRKLNIIGNLTAENVALRQQLIVLKRNQKRPALKGRRTKISRRRLGDVLLEQELISKEQLAECVHLQRQKGQSLAHALVERGYLSEEDLVITLSEQLGIPHIRVANYKIPEEVLKEVPETLARQYQMLPISVTGDVLTVAMADPLNIMALDDLRMLTSSDIEPVVAVESELVEAIEKNYGVGKQSEKIYDELVSGQESAENVEAVEEEDDIGDIASLESEAEGAPVIKLANLIIVNALEATASDIHIEPFENELRVRYRVDGMLEETKSPPKSFQNALTSRYKILSGLDIAEHRLPQDGRFRIRYKGREVDFRVSILPGEHGESIVLRAQDEPAQDNVHFSITSPPEVLPGESFIVNVWAHLDKQRQEVCRRAREAVAQRKIQIQSKGPIEVQKGTVLSVDLTVDALTVQERTDTILWVGEIASATFPVSAPMDLGLGPRHACATIRVGGMQVGKVHFVICIGEKTTQPANLPTQEHWHQKAFASYASEDRDDVLARVQGIEKAAPFMKVFLDVLSLRSGASWEEEILRLIPTNDIFYLFWSGHARDSKYVEAEWRCALKTRGIDFIDPVPLVPPEEAPPPSELAAKHFNDWTVAFMKKP